MRLTVVDASIAFGPLTVFTDFSAEFEAGRVTALVGPSGSGKSSLMAAMAGHLQLKTGRIEVHRGDTPPEGPSTRHVAWVPQGSNALMRRSVLDNVLIAALADGQAMPDAVEVSMDALKQVGLADRPDEQARRLSGGELQRVAIARALASGKELILADEPSANLDAHNTDVVAAILNRLVSRSTIIVATHDPILVAAAHTAVHIRAQTPSHG